MFNPQPKKKPVRLEGQAYKNLQFDVMLRDNWTCQICKEHTEYPPHHIIYRSQGGSDTMENMVCLCGPLENNCHRLVHDGKLKL